MTNSTTDTAPAIPRPGVRAERRSQPRRGPAATDTIKIHYQGESLPARLFDYSNGGLGVRSDRPLEWGSTVNVTGVVKMGGVWMSVRGIAAVVRCDVDPEGGYRIGMRLDQVQWRATEPPASAAF